MISIIIPTRTNSKTLEFTLKSIVDQKNIDHNNDIEIIVVSNGPSELFDFAEEVGLLEKNIKYKIYRTNIVGVSNARNIGLNYASGDKILFLDDDDLLTENTMHTILQESRNDIVLFMDVQSFADNAKNYVPDDTLTRVSNLFDKSKIYDVIQARRLFQNVTAKVFPKEIVKAKEIAFPFEISVGGDVCFMFATLTNRIKFKKLDGSAKYLRRITSASTTAQKTNLLEELKTYLKLIKTLCRIFLMNKNLMHLFFLIYLTLAAFKYHAHKIVLNIK